MARPSGRATVDGAQGSNGRRPEHELLLACARARLDDSLRSRLLALAAHDLDWMNVARTAVRHGVVSLVHHHLMAIGGGTASQTFRSIMSERFFANVGNSLVLTRELVDILARFDEAGIAAIPYKGPILATSLYGNLTLREFTDLDVLVQPEQVLEAKEVLATLGYKPEHRLTPTQDRSLVQANGSYFMRFDRSLSVGAVAFELHWRIPATFRVDYAGIWLRAEPARLMDLSVLHFAARDLLQILCMHGFKHGWNSLKWVCDVAQFIDGNPDLDWNLAVADASRAGGRRVLLLGCAMARNLLDARLPGHVSGLVHDDAVVSELARVLSDRLLERPLPRAGVIDNVRIRERPTDKIRYMLGVLAQVALPTTAERVLWPMQRRARLVRYVTHPVRLAARVAKKHRVGRPAQV